MYVTGTPTRTEDQRREALALGNVIRSRRARLKAELRDGTLTPGAFIEDPPDWTQTMKVRTLLCACPKLGKAKVDRAMRKAQVSPTKTLGGLSERQREALLDYFAAVHPTLRVAG